MNKIYRIVWNEVTATWVAVAEIAKSHSKRSGTVGNLAGHLAPLSSHTLPPLKALVASLALIGAVLPAPTWAQVASTQLPTGGNVVAGTASITQTAATLNINQTTTRAAIDWATFNIGSAAQVNFNQPSSSSVTLNRVLDSNPSQIFGRITAPGQVFLTNPNGVVFAPGARVDVGGLVATTHRIGVDDFMAGRTTFDRNGSTGSVINEGELNAALGGYIALLAPQVRNDGVIIAQAGTVALASGEAITLNFADNGTLAGITATQSQIAALVENKNAVLAPGGLIILSAQAMNRLQGGVINNSGSLEATGLVNDGGRILLDATDSISHTGSINVDAAPGKVGAGGTALLITDLANHDGVANINGSISARGGEFGGDGGFVETSAGRVQIGEATRITTLAPQGHSGTWLIDPTNFAIVAGSGAQTTSSIGASTLQTNLAGGNISIATSATANGTDLGDINVNAALSWSANKLTLTAHNDININAVMTASGTASLDLAPTSNKVNMALGSSSFTGRLDWTSSGALRMNVAGALQTFTVINNATDLQAINSSGLGGRYALGANIDASAIPNFVPIGNNFTGVFDGLGHTVSNLMINRPTTDYVGLFGKLASATIRNVGVSGSVTGSNNVGGLVGYGRNSNISNSYASGSVTGVNNVGGLLGSSDGGNSITNSYSTGNVTGTGSNVGGFIGKTSSSDALNNSFYNIDAVLINGAHTVTRAGIYNAQFTEWLGNSLTLDIANSFVAGSGANAGYYIISDVTDMKDLLAFAENTSYKFRMTADVDLASVPSYYVSIFSGSEFDGATHNISNINVNAPSSDRVGLFGTLSNGSTIKNVNLVGGSVTGDDRVGGLVGFTYGGAITNSSSSAAVTGDTRVGGLVGHGYGATITNSFASGAVSGDSDVGGLVGYGNTISITSSFASGAVSGTGNSVGGLVGYGWNNSSITNSYASGAVEGSGYVGGLVGNARTTSIANSFASGAVSGINSYVGGLVGYGSNNSSITNSYASGAVTGSSYVGGLAGKFYSTIDKSLATGAVTGGSYAGGLTGYGGATITNSFWDTQTTGQAFNENGTSTTGAKTTAELKTLATFTDAGWDMAESSNITVGYPGLGFRVSGATNTWVINTAAPASTGSTSTTTTPTPVVIPPVVNPTPLPTGDGGTVTDTGAGNTGGRADSGFSSPNPLLNANPALVIPLVGSEGSSGSGGASGDVGAGGISISLNLAPSGSAGSGVPGGAVTVSVPKAMATSGAGFSFELPAQVRESLGTGALQATLADGSPLPGWIRFNPVTRRFEAGAVPDGGLPLQIMIRSGDRQVLVVISERAE